MPTFIALKYSTDIDKEGSAGYVYQFIGEDWEAVESAMANGDFSIGDKIFSCEEVAEVEGNLKYTNKKL